MLYDFDKIDLSPGWVDQFEGDLRNVIREGLKHAYTYYNIDRPAVAALMTKLIRKEIPKSTKITHHTINKWTRDDGNGQRFPMQLVNVFAEVTRDPRIMLYYPTLAGLRVLTPIEETHYRIYELEESAKRLSDEAEMLKRRLRDK